MGLILFLSGTLIGGPLLEKSYEGVLNKETGNSDENRRTFNFMTVGLLVLL